MHWIRIVLGAFLLEVVLFVTLVPLGEVLPSPFRMDPAERTADTPLYFAAVSLGCLVFGYLVTRLILRPVTARRVLHGALIGALATAIYVGVAAASPDGLAAVVAGYGTPLFVLINALRIAGCVAGAAQKR